MLILIGIAQLATAQVPAFGKCPNVSVMQNFDARRYLGLWYEVRKYPFIFTLGGKCVTANYGYISDDTISVNNKQIKNGQENTIEGTGKIVQPSVATLTVKFETSPCELNKFLSKI